MTSRDETAAAGSDAGVAAASGHGRPAVPGPGNSAGTGPGVPAAPGQGGQSSAGEGKPPTPGGNHAATTPAPGGTTRAWRRWIRPARPFRGEPAPPVPGEGPIPSTGGDGPAPSAGGGTAIPSAGGGAPTPAPGDGSPSQAGGGPVLPPAGGGDPSPPGGGDPGSLIAGDGASPHGPSQPPPPRWPRRDRSPGGGSPPHWSRRRKILTWGGGIMATLIVAIVAVSYFAYQHLNGNLRQVDISGLIGSEPADLHPQAENILLLGSDTRVGQGRGYGSAKVLNTDHSDTLMIVHIAADRKWADIVSIPRDSWVNIPACRMGNGQVSSPTTFKINEAFTIGNLYGNRTELGIACTVKTIEMNTGIRIDHFLAVNFDGFKDMVNALGGVPECNSKPINDPKSNLHLSAGHHLLNGHQALGYVRARYTLGNGSDLERIGRQQAFMSSLVDRARSKLLNPIAIYHFLDAATKSLTIDSKLGGLRGLYDLAMSLRNLPPSKVTFFTLPTYPRSYVVPTDTANLLWTQPTDSLIFQAFRDDQPVTRQMLQSRAGIRPQKITLTVLNGTTDAGLQDTAAAVLRQDGFRIGKTGDAARQTHTQTTVYYHPGQLADAQEVAAKVRGAALRQIPGSGRVTLMLGSDYGSTVSTSQAPAPQAASSFAPRTASQNICT